MRVLGLLLAVASLCTACGAGDSSPADPATSSAAVIADGAVTLSEFPAQLQLRPDQEVRVRLVGVNPRKGTLSKPTSTEPTVLRVVKRTGTSGDAMTVVLRAGGAGESVVAWTSTPLCACDGPPIPMRIDVQVRSDDS